MIEKWIKFCNGLYEVSNLGRVFSVRSGRLLSDADNGKGYRYITTCVSNCKKRYYVHALVAEKFIGMRPTWLGVDGDEIVEIEAEINHKDLDKSNNRWDNLEYLTQFDNTQHALRHGVQFGRSQQGEDHGMAKLTWKQVRLIRNYWSKHIHTSRDLGRRFGVSHRTILNVVNNCTWKE